MDEFITLIKRYVALSAGGEAALREAMRPEFYKKNTFLLKTEQTCRKVWFIYRGLVRRGMYDDARDVTIWMYWEHDMVTALRSFTQRTPAEEFIQALEDVDAFSISFEETEYLFEKYPEIKEFSRLHQQEKLFCWDSFCLRFPLMDAQSRYEYLSEVAPEIIKRAKLGHIASLMRVTQETLSRVRSRTPAA